MLFFFSFSPTLKLCLILILMSRILPSHAWLFFCAVRGHANTIYLVAALMGGAKSLIGAKVPAVERPPNQTNFSPPATRRAYDYIIIRYPPN